MHRTRSDDQTIRFWDVETGVGLGRQEVVPTLIDKLNSQGNKEMALVYLNSGHSQLSAAAEAWATRNGYRIYKSSTA